MKIWRCLCSKKKAEAFRLLENVTTRDNCHQGAGKLRVKVNTLFKPHSYQLRRKSNCASAFCQYQSITSLSVCIDVAGISERTEGKSTPKKMVLWCLSTPSVLLSAPHSWGKTVTWAGGGAGAAPAEKSDCDFSG